MRTELTWLDAFDHLVLMKTRSKNFTSERGKLIYSETLRLMDQMRSDRTVVPQEVIDHITKYKI